MGAAGSVRTGVDDKTQWENHPKDYVVSLVSSEGFRISRELPQKFILHINYESIDFLNTETKTAIMQFPFQNIICWGSNSKVFRFNVFDYENTGKEDISIILNTAYGSMIEDVTMGTVRQLMDDMEKKSISKEEFQELTSMLIDDKTNTLKEGWMKKINQFSSGRAFLAKQCMDLIAFIAPLAPFEKFDLACLLYTRVLSKDSFQLVVNSFEDEIERDNLLHRLGLDKEGSNNMVTNCKMLPIAPKNSITEDTTESKV